MDEGSYRVSPSFIVSSFLRTLTKYILTDKDVETRCGQKVHGRSRQSACTPGFTIANLLQSEDADNFHLLRVRAQHLLPQVPAL